MPERLQKVLAHAGYGSRRELEGWITAGRIKVNNALAKLGDRVSSADRITVDGNPVRAGIRIDGVPGITELGQSPVAAVLQVKTFLICGNLQ